MDSIKDKIDEYVKLFDEIAMKTDNDQVALGLLKEICKDRRMNRLKSRGYNKDGPATDKQKDFMRKLGIIFTEPISKKEASMLLQRELAETE
jgi:hypothetical protein